MQGTMQGCTRMDKEGEEGPKWTTPALLCLWQAKLPHRWCWLCQLDGTSVRSVLGLAGEVLAWKGSFPDAVSDAAKMDGAEEEALFRAGYC
jgi:hypothetical protein